MDIEKTLVFDKEKLDSYQVKETLESVYHSLDEIGYNANQQIIGYLISGDLGYISNHNESRKRIAKLEREQILEALLNSFLEKK